MFAVSGIVGSEDEWAETQSAWLDCTGGEVFHATEREHAGRHEQFNELVEILAGGHVVGLVVTLDIGAFGEVLPQPLPDMPYYRCLTEVIKRLSNQARQFNTNVLAGQYPSDVPVLLDFTFDDRRESKSNAGQLYRAFVDQPEWSADIAQFGAEVHWDDRKSPRIQMADLLAREGMKDLDRVIRERDETERRAKLALESSGKFVFVPYGRAEVADWWRQVQDLEREDASPGEGYGGYGPWLAATGREQHGKLKDSIGNRIAYFIWLDRMKSRQS